jgi:anti-anti-sigma factor
MAFSAELEMIDGIAKIALSGELDASTAPIFQEEIKKATSVPELKHLVFLMADLDFMASAGLRVLIFNKSIRSNVDIYVISPQETVLQILQKTGYDQGVIIQDSYP